jgi:cell wall-associated NlpC family hydrolase
MAGIARVARLGCAAAVIALTTAVILPIVAILSGDDTATADTGTHGVICAPAEATTRQVGPYGPEQLGNAAIITQVGAQRGIPDQGVVVALMAAMTESGLRNLDHGDRDSLGLFQMRPSQGWGTPDQLLNPTYAATKFYDVLLAVPNWEALAPGAAAQAVERSAFPDRYNKHEQPARQILGALRGTPCPAHPTGVGVPGNPRAQTVINAALSQLGVRYAWGGGTPTGPSAGTGVDQGIVGFDCSGLALYAYAQIGVAVPHQTQAIWKVFQPAITNAADLRPGDLILLSNNGQPGGIHHVAIYLGDSAVVHAPSSGDHVRVVEDIWQSSYWTREFIGAVRPGV